jgi:PPOX class probable F420-dependent enzyme
MIRDQIPSSHVDLLDDETRAYAFLATIMKDNTPQVTPVWFNTEGEYILINSAQGRVKDKNMRARPHVALAIQDPGDPYRYLQIKGEVISYTTEGGREHINALSMKYRGNPKYSGPENEIRVIYKIHPYKVQTRG